MSASKQGQLFATLVVILFVIIGAFVFAPVRFKVWAYVPIVALAGVLVWWFLTAFTGDAKDKSEAMFLFAYVFTFISFAFLVLPPVRQAQTDDQTPIAIIRGCADETLVDQSVIPYPKSMFCRPAANSAPAPGDKADAGAKGKEPSQGDNPSHRYLSLIAIGGVTGKTVPSGCDKDENCQYIEISSGLAVPLYVIILAFVGGAVSLSRRIPEYQKRCDNSYVGTSAEPKLGEVDAREVVVFQIMQLVSAPFIAIAAYYVIGPSTLGTAVGLAFGCGFASEPILLMIRGVITGIRPESTKLRTTTQQWAVSGSVVDKGGIPKANAAVAIKDLPDIVATTDDQGRYSLANVPDGAYTLTATAGDLEGSTRITINGENLTGIEIAVDQRTAAVTIATPAVG